MAGTLQVYLFTDIVESTKLKSTIGDPKAAAAIAEHDRLFRECLATHQGSEQVNPGDGFFASFQLPSQALSCALEFQRRLPDLAEPLLVRVGIHMGESVAVDVDLEGSATRKLVGLAVDTAARVQALAEPGQILVTRHAFDSMRQQVTAAPDGAAVVWLAHGPYHFKGLDEELEVFEAGIEEFSPLRPPGGSAAAARATTPAEEATLGWRPAVGQPVPGRAGWILEALLGEGGFGEVWKATHNRTREQRAFKFCFEADRLRSLKREMTLFRLLKEALGSRPDIAVLHDVQLEEAPFFLEMGYTRGGNLAEWAEAQGGFGKIPLETRLGLVEQIAAALAAAHSVGVLHKDVKPSNVLIEPQPDGRIQCVLTDFGIGQLLDPDAPAQAGVTATGFGGRTATGSSSGTPAYMAPELIAGKPASIGSDVYSVGVLLYQIVVGDLKRPLGQGWQQEVHDVLLRQDIADCVGATPSARLSSPQLLSDRLANLGRRRRVRQRRLLLRVAAALLLVAGGWFGLAQYRAWAARESARSEAREQRGNAARLLERFDAKLVAVTALQRRVERERRTHHDHYSPLAGRVAFAGLVREFEEERRALDRLGMESRAALDRAARLDALERGGSMGVETRDLFADYFEARLREATAADDVARASAHRRELATYRPEVNAPVKLELVRDPIDAEMFLFRFVDHSALWRLVPAPGVASGTAGDAEWSGAIAPGDECLEIVSVAPNSFAAAAGLRAGDLVLGVGVDGNAGAGLIVAGVENDGRGSQAGIRPFDAVKRLGQFERPVPFHLQSSSESEYEITAGKRMAMGTTVSLGLSFARPAQVAERRAPAGLRLFCLARGVPMECDVPPGAESGLRCTRTAYPLILNPRATPAAEVEPGSYLLVVCAPGYELQRIPFVAAGPTVRIDARLHRVGTAPDGFSYVPGGSFRSGGDTRALNAAPASVESIPGFWIAREELTNREWFEFANEKTDGEKYLPVQPAGALAIERDGRWVPSVGGPETPVTGLRLTWIRDYLVWRNERAAAAGERWVYDLPTELQWEKAARGVDGRKFPWGDRWDPSLCVNARHGPRASVSAQFDGGDEPYDMSVYGLFDVAGQRREATRDADPTLSERFPFRGGPWGEQSEHLFRCATRYLVAEESVDGGRGFRLVARPRR